MPVPGKDFRPAGLPACGVAPVFPRMPWWHNVLCDPYERINFFSHAVPGAVLLCLFVASAIGVFPSRGFPGRLPLSVHLAVTAFGHLASACTHLEPDSLLAQKFDHAGIALWVMSTTFTALTAACSDANLVPYFIVCALTFCCVFIPQSKVPPHPRATPRRSAHVDQGFFYTSLHAARQQPRDGAPCVTCCACNCIRASLCV